MTGENKVNSSLSWALARLEVDNILGVKNRWKKGGSMVAMLPEVNRQDHSWKKDLGQLQGDSWELIFLNVLLLGI